VKSNVLDWRKKTGCGHENNDVAFNTMTNWTPIQLKFNSSAIRGHSKSDRVLPTRIPLRFKSNSNRLRPPYYLHPTTYPLLPTTIPAAYSLLPAMPTYYLLPTACYLLPRPTTCIALDLLPLPAPYCVCCGPKGRLMPVPLNMAPWKY
jgi:hypothetical protein